MRIASLAVAAVLMLLPAIMVHSWSSSAAARLVQAEAAAKDSSQQVAVAAEANEAYCTPALKQVLRRVPLVGPSLLKSVPGRQRVLPFRQHSIAARKLSVTLRHQRRGYAFGSCSIFP